MNKQVLTLTLFISCFIVMVSTSQDDGMTMLFNGKDFTGWEQHGGKAMYTVENGEVMGSTVLDTPNSFMCTKKHYTDFILELEFKVDPSMNSGVQIRSNVFDEPKTYEYKDAEGKLVKKEVPAGRVHGYQVEIDPSDRAWTGGIYDEGRRGWLFNLEGDHLAAARKAFKQNEWNHFRVEAKGGSIKTWVNSVPVADLQDDYTPSGLIALQVHGVGNNTDRVGKKVRWRNIRIKEL